MNAPLLACPVLESGTTVGVGRDVDFELLIWR